MEVPGQEIGEEEPEDPVSSSRDAPGVRTFGILLEDGNKIFVDADILGESPFPKQSGHASIELGKKPQLRDIHGVFGGTYKLVQRDARHQGSIAVASLYVLEKLKGVHRASLMTDWK